MQVTSCPDTLRLVRSAIAVEDSAAARAGQRYTEPDSVCRMSVEFELNGQRCEFRAMSVDNLWVRHLPNFQAHEPHHRHGHRPGFPEGDLIEVQGP